MSGGQPAYFRTPSLPVMCSACGKGPSSIMLYAQSSRVAGGAMLCEDCCARRSDPEFKARLVEATDDTMPIGKLPPSIASSLWAGKVPHLRAYSVVTAHLKFADTNGVFLRHHMPKYLQDRVLKGVYQENPEMCKAFRMVFEDLALNKKRRHLKLQRIGLTRLEMTFLNVFLQCGNQLSLNLSFNSLSAAILEPIAHHFTTHPKLHTLNLSYTSIGDAGLRIVCDALKANENITDINLASAGFGVDGCAALSDMLASNTSLLKLYLPFNDMGLEGARALSPGIGLNRGLDTLNLRCNFIGPHGATAIAKALEANDGVLKHLSLVDNSIGEDGALALSTHWHVAGVEAVLQAVVPDYPDMALFAGVDDEDEARVRAVGHSTFDDFNPGRKAFLL